MAYIYKHIRIEDEEVFYIGISSKDDNYQRSKSKNDRSTFWKNYTNLYPYRIEILLDNITWQEAKEIEKELIIEFGKRVDKTGTLVNITDGGEGTLGCAPWNKGIVGVIKNGPCKEETKIKIGEKHRGRIHTEQSRMNMSIGSKGRKRGPYSKERIEKTKAATIKAVGKKVYAYCYITGNFIGEYNTMTEASLSLNVGVSKISMILKGKRKSSNKLFFSESKR